MKRASILFLASLLAVALLRDLVANHCPLFCQIDGKNYFPAFQTLFNTPDRVRWQPPFDSIQDENLWQTFDYQKVVFPPVPFRAGQILKNAAWLPPFSKVKIGEKNYRSWLGTDGNGHDVAAGMVAGARVTLTVGLLTMLVAGLLGILFGSVAGYFGDSRLQVRRGIFWANILAVPTAFFYAFLPRKFYLLQNFGIAELTRSAAVFATILLVFNLLGKFLASRGGSFFSKKIIVPADLWVMRLSEILHSIPQLVLVMSVAAVAAVSRIPIFGLVVIIGLFSWMNLAQLLRAEILRVRELEFVDTARSLGFSSGRVIFRHILPNAIRPFFIALALGAAGAVMLESSLSFLGFTSTQAATSWGSLLSEGRGYYQYWWVSLFPGLATCATVLALQLKK